MGTTNMSGRNVRPWWRWPLRLLLTATTLMAILAAYAAWIVLRFDTEHLPPRYGEVDAQLFLPDQEGESPRPLLVLLGGAEGGNAWASRRWQAQRQRFLDQGFALLAIGYFGLPNTPQHLDRIAVEGVHAAIADAASDSRINGHCIGVIGGSRGSELALLLGSHYPEIDAVIALTPASAVFVSLTDAMITSGYAFEGEPLPFVPMSWSATLNLIVGDIGGAMRKLTADETAMALAAIAVERINGPILLVSAVNDEMWPSRDMADRIMHRLQASGFAHAYEHLGMPGGHEEPLRAFPQIEAFLQAHMLASGQAGCGGPVRE
ncbi:MAG: hypothetical protein KDI37_00405 [Xanthomonadales bacterium]|nr:hypothetical protein [Xanthomonadales bacterium]